MKEAKVAEGARQLAQCVRAAVRGDIGPVPGDLPPELADLGAAVGELFERLGAEVRSARATADELTQALESVRAAQERSGAEAARQGTGVEGASERLRLLSERAGEIATAAETIDGIAAQTNLLALNAALEAARADREESRGFTLFAQEVRKLAERAGTSARDVVALIGQLQEEVTSAAHVMDDLRKGVRDGAQNASRTTVQVVDLLRRGRAATEALHRIRIPDPKAARAAEELRRVRDEIMQTLEDLGSVADGSEVANVLEELASLLPRSK